MIPTPIICKCVVLVATGITGMLISASKAKGTENESNR